MSQPEVRHATPEPAKTSAVRPLAAADLTDGISLRDVFTRLWRGKWVALATMAVAVLAVSAWMKVADPLYTARMVVAPAKEREAGGLATNVEQFAGLASLAGIKLPSDERVSSFTRFEQLITSVTLARRLQEKYRVLQKLNEIRWDPESQRWLPPHGTIAAAQTALRSFFNLPTWTPPSPTSLASYFEKEFKISPVAKSGMREIAFDHKDPELAVQLLRWIHDEADDLLRQEALERTARQLDYIETKLETVAVIEHRQALVELLSEQERKMMMIQVDLPYAADIIEPAIASDEPTFPKPILFLPLTALGGVFLGMVLVFLIDAVREARPARPRLRQSEPSTPSTTR